MLRINSKTRICAAAITTGFVITDLMAAAGPATNRAADAMPGVTITMASERHTFYRMEPDAKVRLRIQNAGSADLSSGKINVSLQTIWATVATQTLDLPAIGVGGEKEITCTIHTQMRPDDYTLKVSLADAGAGQTVSADFPIHIVARPPENQMPVMLWGAVPQAELPMVKEIGFTHLFVVAPDYKKVFDAQALTTTNSPRQTAQVRQLMDEAMRLNLRCGAFLSPGGWWAKTQAGALRTGRDGQPLAEKNANGLYPQVQNFCRITSQSLIGTFGDAPNFECALINTETRDGAEPSFSTADTEAYKKFSGAEIPPEIKSKRGVDYRTIGGFPADRVIADDNPIYTYYHWYWTQGDGWNALHAACQEGLRAGLMAMPQKKFWTWHDPAARVASVYGSSAATDYLGQWTYSSPDPLKILLVDDEMKAIAAGNGRGQKLITGTQLIWYRSQALGANSGVSVFSDRDTGGTSRLISAAPVSVRQSVWCSLSQPVDALYFHGWQSLVPVTSEYGYAYTNAQLQHELARLIKDVVTPLGPSLLKLQEAPGDVAFLESFASQMFAGRGNYGWSTGWIGDAYQILAYTGLQPHVVYEQTLQAHALDSCKVLVLVDCDVLPRSVVSAIQTFQDHGGIVIADEHACPAIRPTITLSEYKRSGDPKADKAALLERASQLRSALSSRYTSAATSQDPEVIIRRRIAGNAQYIFAINDHREAGDYVGHYGRVMENGVPAETVITVNNATGVVYDALMHQRVAVTGAPLKFDAALGPGEGRLFVILPTAIQENKLEVPATGVRGQSVKIRVLLMDTTGTPVNAVVPVQLIIQDSEGRDAERSGYYAACDGKLEVSIDLAPNDRTGMWKIEARDGLSGARRIGYMRVQ